MTLDNIIKPAQGEDYRYRCAGSEALYEVLQAGQYPGDAGCQPFNTRFRDDVCQAEYVKWVKMGAPK